MLLAAPRLRGAGELTAGQLRRARDVEPLLAASPEQVVLVHGDLKGEHLLIDQGRVSGVLDWTDAELGDPATDVAGLAIAVGAPAADRVAAAAGHDPHTRHRGMQLARWDAILRLEQRLSGQDVGPLPLLRRQLQRARTNRLAIWLVQPLRPRHEPRRSQPYWADLLLTTSAPAPMAPARGSSHGRDSAKQVRL